MKFFDELSHYAPNRLFFAIMLGIGAGISYASLIPIVINSIQRPNGLTYEPGAGSVIFFGILVDNANMALLFLVAILCILFFQTSAQLLLTLTSSDVTRKLRIELYRKLLKANLTDIEQVGSGRLMASLTSDVQTIVNGAKAVPDIIVNLFTIFGMLFFLWYLQAEVFVFVLQAIFIGILLYQIPLFLGNRAFFRSRRHVDNLHEGIKALTSGIKELKLNRKRQDNFVESQLIGNENQIIKNQKLGLVIITSTYNFGNMLALFVIGIVAFVLVNYQRINQETLISVFMVLLYITGPISVVLNSLPGLMMANISYQKLQNLQHGLQDEEYSLEVRPVPTWTSLHLNQLTYEYQVREGERKFIVGPIDLTLEKGEIVFIVGGNGSGKSTLSKLVSLYYKPTAGQICFDDTQVDSTNANSYRQTISAIFSDFFLFESILDAFTSGDDLKKVVDDFLQELDLAEKVSFDNGCFSTLKLSDGQRKRLALICAYLEDRDIYLFDEWAADQDPEFRKIFYTRLLPNLKLKGKLVIVISHDSQYFSTADKLVHMDNGKVLSITTRQGVKD